MKRMCEVLEVSRAGFYTWRKRRPSRREQEDGRLLEAIRSSFLGARRLYGSPRVHAELREQGVRCGRHRVARLMRESGLRARTIRLFQPKRHSGEYYRAAGNLLGERDQAPARANEVWVADMTYLRTGEGWLYLAVIMDLCSRRIVGWSMSAVRDSYLALRALNQAWQLRGAPVGVMFHTDQGIEFLNNMFKDQLQRRGMVQSTSRRGHCHDNAHMESFFHTLKTELVYLERFRTRDEARQKVFDYVEVFYNRKRRHSGLGFKSPLEYETENKRS